MKKLQIDGKSTKQVRIDAGMHQLLKVKAAEASTTIKELLEQYLVELLEVQKWHISMLNQEAVDEFRELYKKDAGTTLPDTEAVRLANDLFNALEVLLTYEDKPCNNWTG